MTGTFHGKTTVIAGRGARSRLAEILSALPARRPALVVDRGLREHALIREITRQLTEAGLPPVAMCDVTPDPTIEAANAMGVQMAGADADVVVAIGGGSAMDGGKAAGMLARNGGSASDYIGRNRFTRDPLPLVAIPTTCGTGSEVTWVSVLRDPAAGVKISIKGERMFPRAAILDPAFIDTLPATQVGWTGADALTHAIEAYIVRPATPFSDAFAVAATRTLLTLLPDAIKGEPAAREQIQIAATQAGFAFGNADVGAVHCLSESLGGMHGTPHGMANAMFLLPVLRYFGSDIESRLASLARATGLFAGNDAECAAALLGRIEQVLSAVEMPRLNSLNLDSATLQALARAAEANGSNASCPRRMNTEDYNAILDRMV